MRGSEMLSLLRLAHGEIVDQVRTRLFCFRPARQLQNYFHRQALYRQSSLYISEMVSSTLRTNVWRIAGVLLSYIALARAAPATTLPSAASFYVPSLPGLTQDPNHPIHIYAGHLPSDPKNPIPTPSKGIVEHLYFVLLKPRWSSDKERVILWFNGGPGCSSFDGLMMEVGPWRTDGKGGLKTIDGGWDEYAHVVYIDQPAGTGFSYTSTDSYLHELDEMAAHVVQFLENLYKVFPELATLDTYLAGESFAGQYIPYIADAMLKTTALSVPLKGAAIGNGWIDGRYQYPGYYEFALKAGIIKEDSKAAQAAREQLKKCYAQINQTTDIIPVNYGVCDGIMGTITQDLQQTIDGRTMCMNVYDIRLSDEFPSCGMNWPPDLSAVYPYLHRSDVVSALHASNKPEAWTECQGRVFQEFNVHKSPASVTLLPSLLEKISIMLFAGDQDYICNYVGIERLIEALEWGGSKGLGDTAVVPWTVNGTDAGSWQTARNLTYVKIKGASHMVGFDVPDVAHDLILRFMGVDFSRMGGGSSLRISSSLGDSVKPIPGASTPTSSKDDLPLATGNPEQDKARWEAYYNAGSAALILLLIALGVGIFLYFRLGRQEGKRRFSWGRGRGDDDEAGDAEETIPLQSSHTADEPSSQRRGWKGKGKEKRVYRDIDDDASKEPMFDVGDMSDDEHDGAGGRGPKVA